MNVLLIVLLISTFGLSLAQDDENQRILKCPATSNCECMEHNDLEIKCPRVEPQVFIRIEKKYPKVHYVCKNVSNLEFELLPMIKLNGARSLRMTSCPLSYGMSIASYMKNIQIERISTIEFVSGSVNSENLILSQHFRGLDDIEKFDFQGFDNEIKEFPSDLFVGMRNLKWVRIKVANIHLPVDLFAPLENMEFLELSRIKLQSIDPGFLQNQRKLQSLILCGNELKNLSKEAFIGLAHINELDLSANGMEFLEPDTFLHLTNVTILNLNKNNFASLPDGLLAENQKLREFRLIENHVSLTTLPRRLLSNLKDLQKVMIKCDLEIISESFFEGSKNIEVIQLARNFLQNLPTNLLKDQAKLKILDLSDNLIAHFPDDFFLGTTELEVLKLSKNRWTNISK